MEYKLLIHSLFIILILVLVSTMPAVDVKPDRNTGWGSVEILDISFEDLNIIATIKSINASARSLPVDFYKSRIIVGKPSNPRYVRTILWCISPGEIVEVPCLWIGFGHYIITVKVQDMDEASQEVWWFLFFGLKVD
jgi:hypothetical protein